MVYYVCCNARLPICLSLYWCSKAGTSTASFKTTRFLDWLAPSSQMQELLLAVWTDSPCFPLFFQPQDLPLKILTEDSERFDFVHFVLKPQTPLHSHR